MALDLTLIAISSQAGFIIEKAMQYHQYAADLDKIYDTNSLRLQWQMAQAYDEPQDTQQDLLELIEDSELVNSCYPENEKQNYQFHSYTRGYETINYLLLQYLAEKGLSTDIDDDRIFYGGQDIDYAKQHVGFRCINSIDTASICELLNSIEFDHLLKYYDYNKLSDSGVYKLTQPENLTALQEEFQELANFYSRAKALDAFILVKIS